MFWSGKTDGIGRSDRNQRVRVLLDEECRCFRLGDRASPGDDDIGTFLGLRSRLRHNGRSDHDGEHARATLEKMPESLCHKAPVPRVWQPLGCAVDSSVAVRRLFDD
jgi:hypothetical protein